jgi:hypothetical protein
MYFEAEDNQTRVNLNIELTIINIIMPTGYRRLSYDASANS